MTRAMAAAVAAMLLASILANAHAAFVQDDEDRGTQPRNQAVSSGEVPKEDEIVNEKDRQKNSVPVGRAEKNKGELGEIIDDPQVHNRLQKDDVGEVMINVCNRDYCHLKKLSELKKEEYNSAAAITPVKGDSSVSAAIQPTIARMESQLAQIEKQNDLLESLKRNIDALNAITPTASLEKGNYDGLGNSLLDSLARNSKGLANSGSSTFESAASKGGNLFYAEANLCPMLQIELATSQKQHRDTKQRLDQINALAAAVQSNKNQLESALRASETLREAAKSQALANAREAAEEKGKNSLLTVNLIKSIAEKKAVSDQKESLETELSSTQSALLQEQKEKGALATSLRTANDEKEVCSENLAKENEALQQCNSNLASTNDKLADTEKELTEEREARRKLEVELSQTQAELRSTQSQLKVTNNMLKQTQDQLTHKTQEHIKEQAAREAAEQQLTATQKELHQTQDELREKERELGEEKIAHGKAQRHLEETQAELAATEEARKRLEEKKQELEDDLAATKSNLEQVIAERNQLQEQLDEANNQLNEERVQKAACQVDLAQEKAAKEATEQQLAESLSQLAQEKKARDELEIMIVKVREASIKVQEEVQKLQLENTLLQEEMRKLKNEQEAALALASGCPPTYEKFGTSCYKYIRRKAPWKSAQEQCMQDSANLVSIESREEQTFIVDLLRRYAARDTDIYVLTGGARKPHNEWKWISGGYNVGVGAPAYWHKEVSKAKFGYDCLALTLRDDTNFGKWVTHQCTNENTAICEYSFLPNSNNFAITDTRELDALQRMANNAPPYLVVLPRGQSSDA